MSKILILTASPVRDLIVDTLLAEELQKLGHETSIRPCLREHRKSFEEELNKILDGEHGFVPDVVVMPPIRNATSRDMAETLKHYGLGVVSRHTEASCDWRDFNKLRPERKHEILGQFPYVIDAEIVWSKDESEILSKRPGIKFPVHYCGAFTVDAYLRQDVIAKHRDKKKFCEDRNLDPDRKTLLITSPWGFADSSPDLHIEPYDNARNDTPARNRHFEMIKWIATGKLKETWNIVVTVHPNVLQEPYKKFCEENHLYLDTETNSFDLKVNVDGIIHAGSTMSIGAHFLEIPAWQFGDMNAKGDDSWWGDPESDISKVSPYFKDTEDLYQALLSYQPGSNANLESIDALQKGRYGLMDGKATARAAEIIGKVNGKFRFKWPKSTRDYSQLRIRQDEKSVLTPMTCGICKESFVIINESYLKQYSERYRRTMNMLIDAEKKEGKTAEEILNNFNVLHEKAVELSMKFEFGTSCPHCASKFYIKERPA